MHTTEVGATANVPAFLTKLWKLVDDPNYDHLIHWSQNGKSFIIRNQAQFAKELLPLYFKHNNMASFIRQLNMYGFRKLTNIENSGLRSERDDIEFYHLHFIKDQESSLEFIKRKIKVSSGKSTDENKGQATDLNDLLLDVKTIRGKQESFDNILMTMHKENEALWREVAILRQKHQKQQNIVERLIQFLLSWVHNRNLGIKRKSPLMIGSNEANTCYDQETKKKRLNDISDDYESTKYVSPLISDVTDSILEETVEDSSTNPTDFNSIAINTEENSEVLNTLSYTAPEGVDSLLDPLQSVIESSLSDTVTQTKESSKRNSPVESIGEASEELDSNEIVSQISGIGPNGIKVIPSTSGDNLILTIEPAQIETEDSGTELVFIETEKNNALSKLDSPVISPKSSLNTPTPLVIHPDESGNKKENNSTLTVNHHANFYSEDFSDHLDNIDFELNWLQEQLSNVEGLSFDPNSLIDLDLSNGTSANKD